MTSDACDCPTCSGEDIDPAEMLSELLEDVASLAEVEDPFEAELAGATVVAALASFEDDLVPLFVQALVPQIEDSASPGALALLLVLSGITSGTHDEIAKAATAAAERLTAAGVPQTGVGRRGGRADPAR